jgi:hypothetical protein
MDAYVVCGRGYMKLARDSFVFADWCAFVLILLILVVFFVPLTMNQCFTDFAFLYALRSFLSAWVCARACVCVFPPRFCVFVILGADALNTSPHDKISTTLAAHLR